MGQATPNRIPRVVVLVVEDEPALRMIAVDIVDDAGFEAVEASNASDALAIMETREALPFRSDCGSFAPIDRSPMITPPSHL